VALEKGARVISGKIKPANDGNSAELEFARDDLSDLDGAYTLMFVDKSGTKTPSKNIIQLRPQPLITGLLNAQLIAAAGGKVTLVGKRLDLIGEFDLVPDSFSGEPVKNSIVDPKPSASDTSATVVFPALPPGTYHLRYIETKQKKMIDLKSLTVQTAN
jgi:hypothetical protein